MPNFIPEIVDARQALEVVASCFAVAFGLPWLLVAINSYFSVGRTR
jgi:hypothetical protein